LKILLRIIGTIIGAALGLLTCVALIQLLSGGNVVFEGFMFLPGAPVSLIVGAIAGAIIAKRTLQRLDKKSISDADQVGKRRFILAMALGIPTAFIVAVWIARETKEPPSDASMLRFFERHYATFDTLVEMASADKGLDRVDQTWTMPADTTTVGVTLERLADYRRLLSEVDVSRGFQVAPDHSGFNFLFWLRGSAISDDTTKGFAYRTSPPPITVQTLDGIHPVSSDSFISYRHIQGNWYLFYEFIPG
jgi:hypothetical protein